VGVQGSCKAAAEWLPDGIDKMTPNGPSTGILDANGQPVVSAERVRMEKACRFNPLKNWTPDVLTRQLEAYARGNLRQLAWLMEWIEKHDDMIQTVAPKAKAAVSRHGYDILLRDGISKADDKLAKEQEECLRAFYDRIETGHAINQDECGGMRLLVSQVMDGYAKGRSVHHIIWKPDAARGLGARLVHVPLWFFEATEGRLRFLERQFATKGTELEELGGASAWMVSKGRGVMVACAIARMFKTIPLQDWLTYCDRHGMPGFVGRTSATKGQPGWSQIADAVAAMGSEFGAVVNQGDAIDVLDLTSKGELPYPELIDRMDRAIVAMWRGGDLSTLSRGNGGVGSNPQQRDTEDLDADNAVWVAETIDRQITRRVIDYYFGPKAPQLAYLSLRTKMREDVRLELEVVAQGLEVGVRVSRKWWLRKFGVVEAAEGDSDDQMRLEWASRSDDLSGNLNRGEQRHQRKAKNQAAANSARDAMRSLYRNALAVELGVRPKVLAPLESLLRELAIRVEHDGISETGFRPFLEDAAVAMPELFDPASTCDLADALQTATTRYMLARDFPNTTTKPKTNTI
jgi:phage gp29-like protein